jgi:hypothetical protein
MGACKKGGSAGWGGRFPGSGPGNETLSPQGAGQWVESPPETCSSGGGRGLGGRAPTGRIPRGRRGSVDCSSPRVPAGPQAGEGEGRRSSPRGAGVLRGEPEEGPGRFLLVRIEAPVLLVSRSARDLSITIEAHRTRSDPYTTGRAPTRLLARSLDPFARCERAVRAGDVIGHPRVGDSARPGGPGTKSEVTPSRFGGIPDGLPRKAKYYQSSV